MLLQYLNRLNAVRSATLLNQPPAILKDGNTVAWYDSSNIATVIKDGSNFVSRWNDKLGSGHDLIQATGASQPLWGASGITFDGINDYLKTTSFTFNQPEFMYLVLKMPIWRHNSFIMDGYINNTGALYEYTTSPNIESYVGNAPALGNSNLIPGAFGIIRFLLYGVNSKLKINKTAATTGNPGVNNMSGITIGCAGNTSAFANIVVKEMIFRKVSDTVTNEGIIYNYLEKKYAIL